MAKIEKRRPIQFDPPVYNEFVEAVEAVYGEKIYPPNPSGDIKRHAQKALKEETHKLRRIAKLKRIKEGDQENEDCRPPRANAGTSC